MSNLSLRGVDTYTLARIKSSARRRKVSVNRVIVETLQQQFRAEGPVDDGLLALAGKWSRAQADAFDAAVAPFGEIDAGLWVAKPVSRYNVTPIALVNAGSTKRVNPEKTKGKSNRATRK